MARHLKPGDRVARPQLDRTIHGEVITYNGELRVLREDTGEMDLTVGWYVLDRDTGCGDATCTTCAAPKLPTPTVGLEAATTLAQLALAGLEQPITVHTLAWRESGAEDPEDAGGEFQPGLVVVCGSDEPIRLRLDVDTLRPLSDHAEVLTPIGVTLKPLDVKPDSVIVVSMPKASPTQMLDQFSLFQKALKKRLGDGVLVVGVEQGTTIDVLADQLLPLGRAVLPQEEVLRLQAWDTRATLLEEALRPWLESRAAGPLPRTTQGWVDRLTDEMNASKSLEREVRRLGVGQGQEGEEAPVVSREPGRLFVTYKGERREGDWSESGHHVGLGWTNDAIAIYAWEHGTPAPRLHPSAERSEEKLPYGSLQVLPGVRFGVKEEGAGEGHVWLLPRFTAIRARVEDVVMEMEQGWEQRTKAWADYPTGTKAQSALVGENTVWTKMEDGSWQSAAGQVVHTPPGLNVIVKVPPYVPGGLTISDDDDVFNPRKV